MLIVGSSSRTLRWVVGWKVVVRVLVESSELSVKLGPSSVALHPVVLEGGQRWIETALKGVVGGAKMVHGILLLLLRRAWVSFVYIGAVCSHAYHKTSNKKRPSFSLGAILGSGPSSYMMQSEFTGMLQGRFQQDSSSAATAPY